jgi:hypothetical protein
MASPLDPSPVSSARPPVATLPAQGQQDLPSLTEARQIEQLAGARPNAWRRLQDFSGSGRLTAILLFLPPALLLFTLFVTLPVAEAAYYSFFNWNGYGAPTKVVGLENFERVWRDPIFHHSLFNNLLVVVARPFMSGRPGVWFSRGVH